MNKFWELRMILFDSHVDEKTVGYFKTKEGLEEAMNEPSYAQNGSLYIVEHEFED